MFGRFSRYSIWVVFSIVWASSITRGAASLAGRFFLDLFDSVPSYFFDACLSLEVLKLRIFGQLHWSSEQLDDILLLQ